MSDQLEQIQSMLSAKKPNPDKAIHLLKPLLNKEPSAEVVSLLGKALILKNQPQKAETLLKESIQKKMISQEVLQVYSLALWKTGKLAEAEMIARQAVKMDTSSAESWIHLGKVMIAGAKAGEALPILQRANQIDPSNSEVAFLIGSVYADQGLTDKALQLLNIALKIDPNYLDAILKKAAVLNAAGKFNEVEQLYEHYMVLMPEQLATFKLALAELYRTTGKYEKSLQQYDYLLSEFPRLSIVLGGYANLLLDLGRFDEAEKYLLKAHKADPDNIRVFNAYLMAMHYNPVRTQSHIFKAYQQYARLYRPEKQPLRPEPDNKKADKKLRLGLLSSGFRKHPVGWMIALGLEQLPKDQFEIYAYSLHNKIDEITNRIHHMCAAWRNVKGKSEQAIEQQIRADHIDILVDLNGVSADSRVQVILNEPTPVIVKWVGGLFNTSGLPAVDYLISDHYETPEGEDKWYTEKLVRLPHDYICYLPPDYAPEVASLPVLNQGHITFGCFNNPIKINQKLLEKWARILHRVPESRLLLKSKQFGSAVFTDPVASLLEDLGIDRSRILFEGFSPHPELLKAYNQVDIALDPWPYSGGLSTCEALWMGVPVITCPGPTFAGKHSKTHLRNAGYAGFVAKDWDEYVDKAVALAQDPENLASIRAEMRDRVRHSPLCDGERFGIHLGQAFREMWKQRVRGWKKRTKNWAQPITISPQSDKSREECSVLEPGALTAIKECGEEDVMNIKTLSRHKEQGKPHTRETEDNKRVSDKQHQVSETNVNASRTEKDDGLKTMDVAAHHRIPEEVLQKIIQSVHGERLLEYSCHYHALQGIARGVHTDIMYGLKVSFQEKKHKPVSLVVKIVVKRKQKKDSYHYWMREALFHEQFPVEKRRGLNIPDLLALEKEKDKIMMVFSYIEDVGTPWTREDYLNVATSVSRFNAPLEPGEAPSWLAKGQLLSFPVILDSARIIADWLGKNGFKDTWVDHAQEVFSYLKKHASSLLKHLHTTLPLVYCHSDLHRNNLIRGEKGIFAVDWENVSQSLPGEDIGRLVHPEYAGRGHWPEWVNMNEWIDDLIAVYIEGWKAAHGEIQVDDVEIAARMSCMTRVSFTLYKINNLNRLPKEHIRKELEGIIAAMNLYLDQAVKIMDWYSRKERGTSGM
ncbi:tetratricopeptide repeat protein [Balneolaceae bacterium ANBcel3]|nr:tetratricopeptide repeat protein [Balneolaceae bacterium ANBcel3]